LGTGGIIAGIIIAALVVIGVIIVAIIVWKKRNLAPPRKKIIKQDRRTTLNDREISLSRGSVSAKDEADKEEEGTGSNSELKSNEVSV